MENSDILSELKKLAPPERLAVLEAAVQQLREELSGTPSPKSKAEKRRQMAAAAEALRADYAPGGELTAFTSLDGEDIHASG